MMHGPITLQNLYQAIPAATFHFAEGWSSDSRQQSRTFPRILDEYVWHANRPVNMILASGVQLPNVLTEPPLNTNLPSEQFFSKVIEDLLVAYQHRYPGDSSSALKQLKHVGLSGESVEMLSIDCLLKEKSNSSARRMNGFETLMDVVQRRHLGKLQRYFLNVVSTNRHYHPYDLITVPEHQVNRSRDGTCRIIPSSMIADRSGELLCFLGVRRVEYSQSWSRCGISRLGRMVSTCEVVACLSTDPVLS